MENDIALMVSGYLAVRLGIVALVACAIYSVLKPAPKTVPIRSQSHFARERVAATQSRR